MKDFTLDDLAAIVRARTAADAGASYTKALLDKGPAHIARKFGEEAVELVVAAVEGEADPVISETADVLYHMIVLLQARGIALSMVMAELARRTGQSGHEEKAARPG